MLELIHISYQYPSLEGSQAGMSWMLDQVSLMLRAGERVAIVGANGSGKSTLLRCAAAQLNLTRGSIVLDGRRIETAADGWYLRSHVGIVAQDPDNQIVASTVFEEVAFGPCNLGLPPNEVYATVAEALAACDLAGFERREVSTLSGGQRQRLAIAGVLAMRPDYLLLDEPCSMLDQEARAKVCEIVERVARGGTGVLCVTHELSEVMGFDRIVVMEHGHVLWEGTPVELLANVSMLGRSRCLLSPWLECARRLIDERLLCADDPLGSPEACGRQLAAGGTRAVERAQRIVDIALGAARSGCDGRPVSNGTAGGLCGGGLRLSYGTVDSWGLNVPSVRIGPGEVLLVAGKTGSGKSTLAQVLAGLLEPQQGTVLVDGLPVRPGVVGYAFQRAEDQIFADSVIADVAFGPRNLGRGNTHAVEDAERALGLVGLDPCAYGARSPFALSGGQMRRVALAGVLAMDPSYVIFDEPTVGLDAEGVDGLATMIGLLAARGVGILVVTHDMERLMPMATRVIVLESGAIAWQGEPAVLVDDWANSECPTLGPTALAGFLRGLHGSC